MQFSSRRSFLSSASALGVAGLANARSAFGSSSTGSAGEVGTADKNVLQYGARADQSFDNTQAFQAAMDDAAKAGGGTIYAPPGGYLFRGNLKVPRGVTLRGSFGCVPSHSGIVKNTHAVRPGQDGTALLVTGGKGQEDGVPFLTAGTNSTVAGLTIYYPEQVTDATPVPYPWAIAMRGDNAAVLDVELLNPYQGIDAKTSARHNIRNVTGQPIRRGIFVDAIYDIGRIENVHFNPWWTSSGRLYQWQLVHGEAFVFPGGLGVCAQYVRIWIWSRVLLHKDGRRRLQRQFSGNRRRLLQPRSSRRTERSLRHPYYERGIHVVSGGRPHSS